MDEPERKWYMNGWDDGKAYQREEDEIELAALRAKAERTDKLEAENARLRAVETAADGMAEALKQSLLPYLNEINTLWVRSLSQTALDAYNAALKGRRE